MSIRESALELELVGRLGADRFAELGVVASLDDAVALCAEFLNGDIAVDALKTSRWSGGAKRGGL